MAERAKPLTPEELEEQREYARKIRELTDRPHTYHIITYGCQMNAHDSEILAGMLGSMGLQEAERDEADLVIFNTCCVRDNAERRALGNVTWLNEIKKKRPSMKIGVCGCMIQEPGMAEKIMKQYRFVDLAFGTADLYRFPQILTEALNSSSTVIETGSPHRILEGLPVSRSRRESAYVSIMQGCDNFCTYCIVPYVRGRERSRNASEILEEIRHLQEDGVMEIMLLGQNVNSYRSQDGVTFPELLSMVDRTGIRRIRFMTSHPKDLLPELMEVMAGARHVLPQFHLPVQSGSNEILRRMNRQYTRETYLERVEQLRRAIPGIGLTTDMMVAFPGETESQFQETLSLTDEVGFDSAFTFVYSPRVGTAAARMENQIPPEEASRRIQALIALQERRQQEVMQRFLGTEEEVLVEGMSRRSHQQISGRGTHGLSVTFPGRAEQIGTICRVRITGVRNNTLVGRQTENEGAVS